MRLLTFEKKHLFVDKLMKLRQQLNAFKPKNTLQSLELFENQLTLNEMEACFFGSEPEEINANLMSLLSSRWGRICNSNMCYTQQPDNLVNQLCFEIAKEIAPPASTTSEIEALEPNTGYYCLLMPSLENTEDVYGNNIHTLGLHEFVLSDNARVFIPLAQCLHQASLSDEGRLRQTVAIDGGYPELTPSEIVRVSQHSQQASELYQAVIAFNKQRLLGDDIGAKLSQLAKALRSGGAHGSGSELNAGSEANLGILAFGEYWDALSERQKITIFTETPKLEDVLGRLFRPDDVNYKETRFCVELLADALDPIIQKYNAKPTIRTLHDRVLKQENAFRTAIQKHHGLAIIPKEIPPKHILHRIFKLEINEQKVLFKQQGCENSLIYALAHEPDALIEFELDEESKQYAISVRINVNNESALIVAAKKGETNAIELLLSWGAQIESHNLNNCTALHWAAIHGHIDAVTCLLEHGALLDARECDNRTPLLYAVKYGHEELVRLLLEKNADINVRSNAERVNALDLAIAIQPKLIEPILMKLVTLPADKQTECLLNVPGGPYPNVLFYAATNKPTLFDTLVSNVPQELTRAVCEVSNEKGYTPLILAAQIGAHESIRKLLAFGLEIESHDLNNSTALHWAAYNGHVEAVACLLEHGALLEARGASNCTALHWAANNGHIDAVTCLLEHGALLDARECDNRTPLLYAVKYGHEELVRLLLEKNADINVRSNAERVNALDLAIAIQPKLIEPILMKLVTLPADKQTECLLNVPGGPYDDVYAYVAAEKPEFLNRLILNSLKESNASTADTIAILAKMHFDEHIEHIAAHYQRMKKKSLSNSNYINAASAAKTLLMECGKAKVDLFQSDAIADIKILSFKNACKSAIETAKPVLEKHREWGKMLAAFLLTIITFPISLLLYATGFFSVKTESDQLLESVDISLTA